ncbi:thioesterase II family protein [Paenibacillus dendritiformis]|uniref:thioesterase II family protein n=1 Tax=Paenibacillus dendritiformis TaxID=130049 RepID=UPI0018CE853C|nr:alpha/beta fold hydrolase [Paenibacillus dendritiformis]
MSAKTSQWLQYWTPLPNASFRLFCLHHAGGSASSYVPWRQHLPKTIELCPIQLPGRENRYEEQFELSIPQLVRRIAAGLSPYLDRPYAIFGHSMGGLLGYELAHELRSTYSCPPRWLFVSGVLPPERFGNRTRLSELPQEKLLQALERNYGTDISLFENKEYANFYVPILRADFGLVEAYRHGPKQPLPCPIKAYSGRQDPLISLRDLVMWERHTSHFFSYRIYEGGHFFLNDCIESMCADIDQCLRLQLQPADWKH